jgi:EpsI family protein
MRLFASGPWAPVAILAIGVLVTSGGVRQQRSMPLAAPLEEHVPMVLDGMQGEDVVVSEAEQRVAGMSEYVLRVYTPPSGNDAEALSLYVGYYDQQTQGKTIHSPKNCLPGGGWEPLTSTRERMDVAGRQVTLNRYLIGNGSARAVVLYWYQGRGRVEANEYLVKWNLLRDQALHGRSDEALVRVIVPVSGDDEEVAYQRAVDVAREMIPRVERALPD